ncbi:MAG: hypothetical protein ABMB14_14955, partial [Myxococcota bacterium]
MSVPVGFVIAAWAWAAPEPGGVDAPMAPPMAPSVAPVDAPAAPSVDAEGIPGIPPGIPPNPADVQNLAYRIGLG